MKAVFSLVVMVHLYLPAFWFARNVMRGVDLLDLSFVELLGAAYVSLMPLAIIFLGQGGYFMNKDSKEYHQ